MFFYKEEHMAFYGEWSTSHKRRLKKLVGKAKENRDIFIRLVRKDPLLSKRGEGACIAFVKRNPKFGSLKLSDRFFIENLSQKEYTKLLHLLEDDNVSYNDIRKKIPNLKEVDDNSLRLFAARKHIRVNKFGRHPRGTTKAEKRAQFSVMLRELRAMIIKGDLVSRGMKEVYGELKKKFPKVIEDFSFRSFVSRVERIIWDKKTTEALSGFVGNDLPLERFLVHHNHIPDNLLKKKAKALRGASRIKAKVKFLRGMGRIGDVDGHDGSFEFPKSSPNNPINIPNIRSYPQISIINGANIGLRHQRLMEENPVRRAFADANRHGDDAVFVVNPFDINTKKASGGFTVLRAFASGLNINLAVLDKFYLGRLKRKGSRIVYETVAERFVDMLTGLAKTAIKPRGNQPEFGRTIYIILGYKEEEIISNAAAWELGYKTRLEQEKIDVEIRSVKAAIAKHGYSDDLGKELEDLTNLRARTIQSNIVEEELQRYTRKVMHYIVRKIEEMIPNAKVIGQGTTHIKIKDDIVELNVPNHLRVTSNHLAAYNQSFGARAVMGEIAKTAVICHPYALGFRTTSREINIEHQRAEARIFVAPIAVDGKFLRAALKDAVRNAHPITQVVRSPQFEPGILRLSFYKGIVSADPIPLESLVRKSVPIVGKNGYPGQRYIWLMVATDPHFGSRSREEVQHKESGRSLGVSDAVIQMLRDADLLNGKRMPVHIFTVNDDPSQGNHFDTHKQPHPEEMSFQAKEQLVRTMPPQEAVQFLLDQDRKRGLDWLENQIQQVKDRHIRPNLDFFAAILRKNASSRLVIKGISQIRNRVFDARDMGAVNWGTGNHLAATIERNLTEGSHYRDYLRALLYGELGKYFGNEWIDRLVVAPLEGNQFFGWGTIQIPGGYEWAIELRSDPPRLSSWADPLLAAVNNDALRGDYGLYMTGRKTLKVYGDKHFFAAANTPYAYYHMCASGTATDLYGHRGFPPNNTGISFVGLPVGGPMSGPILLRTLHIEHIRKYFDKPYKFDWDSFLPNPA